MNKATSVTVIVLVSFVLIFCFGYFLESGAARHLYSTSFAHYRAVENAPFVAGSRYTARGANELYRLDAVVSGDEEALVGEDDGYNADREEDDYSQYSDESPPINRETPLDSLEARVKEWKTVHSSNLSSLPLGHGPAAQKSPIKGQKYLPGPERNSLSVQQKLDARRRENDGSAKYGALYRESANNVFIKKPASRNWRSLPKEFYQLAPFIFDTVPKEFLPEFKNPCWYSPKKQLLCLPYFYLLGFPKCGTTDLWDKINNHPQVARTRVKETHFWRDRKTGSSTAFYKYLSNALFLSHRLLSGDTGAVYCDGSATTIITHSRFVKYFANVTDMYTNVDIIKELTPKAKMIIAIREPVERLYSGYLYHPIKERRSARAFHSEAQKYISDFNKCLERDSQLKCVFEKRPENGRSQVCSQLPLLRLKAGIYAPHIKAWVDGFGFNQVMVIRLEDWKVNCPSILPKIFEFLGLKPLESSTVVNLCTRRVKNQSKRYSVGPMLSETRSLLEQFYAPFNEQLFKLLNYSTYVYS
ncbi:Carbohydrate sulfotransferase 15 [Holothuria leucospilota]|uniref:Carbohydrate sulfotransferase 15 n=1 Tax=Holothuria leucospilota TaxID=206669 RepID=A0A9Q1BGW6_HOLLE|nr:Carbohydrate sulfotransferase 15 [Holothuria leucospilota]